MQMRMGFNILMVFLFAMALVYGFLFYQLHHFSAEFNLSYPVQSKHHLQLNELVNQLMFITILTIGVMSIGLFAVSIYITHKVAGPAYVIKRSIEQLTAGDFDIRQGLRDGDELVEIDRALQKLAATYKEKFK